MTLITCPSCSIQYQIPASDIGEAGRQVRCVECQETWFEPSPAAAMDADRLALQDNLDDSGPDTTPAPVPAPTPAPNSSQSPEPSPAAAPMRPPPAATPSVPTPPTAAPPVKAAASFGTRLSSLLHDFEADNSPKSLAPDVVAPPPAQMVEAPTAPIPNRTGGPQHGRDMLQTELPALILPEPTLFDRPAIGADVLIRDQADAEKLAKRRRTIFVIWVVPLILVILSAILAYIYRQPIVNRLPQTATLYNALNIPVKETGLMIDPPIAKTAVQDGRTVITIEGHVRNISGRTQPIPLIEMTLHDRAGETLSQWFVEPARTTLNARERLAFSTQYADPPGAVVGLRYRFVDRS